ncbi:MAG: hypothetical protein ACRDRJ_38690 [Streptosporangiaceae bacterium]
MGVHSVVLMRRGPAGMRQSGTARQAFGAMVLVLPDDVDASAGDRFGHGMQSTVHTWPDDW